jgi:hypothetical protein
VTRSTSALLVLSLAVSCGDAFIAEEAGSAGAGASGAATSGGGIAGSGAGCNDCEAPSFYVCGDDGKTYDVACGGECGPKKVACEHKCPCGACDDLADDYADALAEAKKCNPDAMTARCTEQVSDALACACATTINLDNTAAAELMMSIQQQWNELACGQAQDCPAVECPMLVGAECTSNGSDGKCEDRHEGG